MATILKMAPSPASDPSKPQFVVAPSPADPNKPVILFTHPETICLMLGDTRNAAMGQYAGLVHGEILAQTEAGETYSAGTGGLAQAIALFRGIKRPCVQNGTDSLIHIYVTNPRVDFMWPEDRRYSARGPMRLAPPKMSVFTTFVIFDPDMVRKHRDAIDASGGGPVDGIILNWEWTLASPTDRRLPDEFDSRYEERVWAL